MKPQTEPNSKSRCWWRSQLRILYWVATGVDLQSTSWGDMNLLSDDIWIVVTFAAAIFQTFRFILQKVLATATLSPTGATFARFLYSAPLIAMLTALYLAAVDQNLPLLNRVFWTYALSGALAQVVATICLVSLFKSRNFAVGVTLMKTEVILSVIIGLLLLGEGVSAPAFAAIGLGVAGVLLLSSPPDTAGWGWSAIWHGGVRLGLSSGLLFAISAVCYRGASLQIDAVDPLVRASVTLSVVTGAQMLGMALWLVLNDAPQITAVWRARRVAGWIGLMSMGGSIGWFVAFTLQTAAYVKAVGQVELIFGLLASILFFKEKPSMRELAGMAILGLSILMLVLVI